MHHTIRILRHTPATCCHTSDFQDPFLISADYLALCQPESAVDYLTVIVACEVVLLVAVLAKLAYDAWHYHKTGEMPWLARNICLGVSYSGA